MKKNFLLFNTLFIATVISVLAQTVHQDFRDGAIYFKLKDSYIPKVDLNENPRNVEIATLPFLENIVEISSAKNGTTAKLSKPFAIAKTSKKLQRIYEFKFSDVENVKEKIALLEQCEEIEYAERVPLYKHEVIPNDPNYGTQWALSKINAPAAWDIGTGSSQVVVAIVDDGSQTDHPDIAPNLWVNPNEIPNNNIDDDNNGYIDDINGWDFGSDDNNPTNWPGGYHGTHVAGLAGAATNNGIGMASISHNIKLMILKVGDDNGNMMYGVSGVIYAATNGAHVINMSFGTYEYSATMNQVTLYAYDQGCVLVSSAGNENSNSAHFPSSHNEIISVGYTNSSDVRNSSSNYGPDVDVMAPGTNIYSTYSGSTYQNLSGSSMASPIVAGLCALVKSKNLALTNDDVRDMVEQSCVNIDALNPGYAGQLGYGRIDAAAAMASAQASLLWAPVSEFTANFTEVNAGGSVSFTDHSLYNAGGWIWTFEGGTPGTFNGQNPPPIQYNTPGTYDVTLTVSNSNGPDTELKAAYINVNPGGGCENRNYDLAFGTSATWNLAYFTTGGPNDSYVQGVNVNDDLAKSNYFDINSTPFDYIEGVYTYFYVIGSTSNDWTKTVAIKIWDGTSGSPGTELASFDITMDDIKNDIIAGYLTYVKFPTPVAVPASNKFFAGFDISNLSYNLGDRLSALCNTPGETVPGEAWEQKSFDGLWYTQQFAYGIDVSLAVFPNLTNTPSIATFTQSATTVCQGEQVTFDATGSTYEDTLLWAFWNASPENASDLLATATYDQVGTHDVVLYVIGGGCGILDTLASTVTVEATPIVSASSDAVGNTICEDEESTVLTATGASTFAWSPPAGLSGTTGSSVTADPTITTTYTVIGTTGNCSSNPSLITIIVDPCTTLDELFSSTNIAHFYNSSTNMLEVTINDIASAMGEEIEIQIITDNGQLVSKDVLMSGNSNQRLEVDMNKHANSIYYLRVMSENGNYFSKFARY